MSDSRLIAVFLRVSQLALDPVVYVVAKVGLKIALLPDHGSYFVFVERKSYTKL